ncbi:MAG: hypothetical protein ABI370_06285 [Gammaproteobacteria bacterium]
MELKELGGWYSRKTDLADTVVYMVLMGRSQFGHLEVFSKGSANVANGQLPARLDWTRGRPVRLNGIGTSHWFGFYGGIRAAQPLPPQESVAARTHVFQNFCQTTHQQRADYTTSPAPSESAALRDNVGMRRSPAATATGR